MTLIAVGQLCSSNSMEDNLAQCRILAYKTVKASAQALFLPEASDYIASGAEQSVALAQPVATSPFVLGLEVLAVECNIFIHVGIHESIPEPALPPKLSRDSKSQVPSKIKNTAIWITPDSQADHRICNRYEKLHLFDMNTLQEETLASRPAPFRESATIDAGTSLPSPFTHPSLPGLGRMISLICFDVRFSTISTFLTQHPRNRSSRAPDQPAAEPAQTLLFPSAFTVPTGRLGHWHILLRARAIETQSWVIAAAQVGRHAIHHGTEERKYGPRTSYGHSLVVNPLGEIVAEATGLEEWSDCKAWEPEIILADVDVGMVDRIRKDGMPLSPRWDVVDLVAAEDNAQS